MLKWLVVLFISTASFAAPQTLEVWFLSAAKVSELNLLLSTPLAIMRPLTAELQCQQMGDYCFDPQYGLYRKDETLSDVSPSKIEEDKSTSIPTAKSVERDLVSCDPNNFFDIFCGKAKPEEKKQAAKLDLWIDTSSSMREMDFSDKEGGCFRKSLVNRLDKSCGFNQKMNIMMFDTSIKQAGTSESLCTNHGLNDYKKLIDWIERSDAKKLVIITDIYELHKEFADYVESKKGKLKGDSKPLTAAELLDLVDDLAKSCQ